MARKKQHDNGNDTQKANIAGSDELFVSVKNDNKAKSVPEAAILKSCPGLGNTAATAATVSGVAGVAVLGQQHHGYRVISIAHAMYTTQTSTHP